MQPTTTDRLIELYRLVNRLNQRGLLCDLVKLREAKAELRRIEKEQQHEGR